MRLITFILSTIIMFQSYLPCADGTEYAEKAKSEIVKGSTQQKDKDHEDACSPFCHCTCCAGFSINHFISRLNYTDFTPNRNFSHFLPSKIIEVSLPIWQPPQLVA